ncbi:MAG: DUF1569 domain-containing protein [Chitinophagaceae bacterium]
MNLFDPAVKQEIMARINKLSPQTQRQWGKMDVAQMFAHCRLPLQVIMGQQTLKANAFKRMIFPLFKKILYSNTPYKQGLPTDKLYIMTGSEKEFHQEKQKLIEQIHSFNESSYVIEIHPVFGTLTKEQWSKATWKHLDHHLKQFSV